VLACQRGASAVTPEWAKNRARTRRLASGPLGLLTAGGVPIAAAGAQLPPLPLRCLWHPSGVYTDVLRRPRRRTRRGHV